MSALLAGLPVTVPGSTVNRLCASGLQAIMDAARAIQCGDGKIFIAGGVESITRAPFIMAKSSSAWNRSPEIADSTIGWRFPNNRLTARYYPYSMGETAENVAKRYNLSREAQDIFAMGSQNKYFAAQQAGKWKDEPGYGAAKSGHIALQAAHSEVEKTDICFRNIKIKLL